MLSAILFDLDGTLTNTDPIHFRAWQEHLNQHGLTIDETFYKTRISGKTNPVIIEEILPHLSEAAGQELADAKEARFRELATQEITVLDGLTQVLDWAQQQQLPLAVVTNAPPENAYFMLETLKLNAHFQTIVISDEIGVGKPDPAPYNIALGRLGVAPETAIAFEDSPSGIRSAVAAGIPTVGIASTHNPQVLYDLGAMLVIPDFTDEQLWDLLKSPGKVDGPKLAVN
ncbi:MAG: HAD family phosphatase [Trichocoleus desertorum ATA4-8-CV12]|jgi:beta-phosphoglucomutase|nr:HAD family phosphatase [Trichocoleus desertorum ATA4-8-CV12]